MTDLLLEMKKELALIKSIVEEKYQAGGFYSKYVNPDFSIGNMTKQEQIRLLAKFLDGKDLGDEMELAHLITVDFVKNKPEWAMKLLKQFAGWEPDDAIREAKRYLNSPEGKTMDKILKLPIE